MAAALPIISIAMSVAGPILGGIEKNNAAKAGAKIDEENARLGLLSGEQQALQTRRDERMQAGDMIASQAGSGIELGSGSAADVIAQSAYQRELEILNIRTGATRQANNLYQAAADKRAAGKAAIINGIFGAASKAISGASSLRASNSVSAQTDKEYSYSTGGGTQASATAVPPMRVKGPYM